MEIIERLDNNDSLKSIQYIEVIASHEERNIANLIEQEFNSVVDLTVAKERATKIVNSAIKMWWDDYQLVSIPNIPEDDNADLKNRLREGLPIKTNTDIFVKQEATKANQYVKNWMTQNIGIPESPKDIKVEKEVIKKFTQEAKKLIEQLVRNEMSMRAAEQIHYTLKKIRSEQLKNMSKKDKKNGETQRIRQIITHQQSKNSCKKLI